MHPTHAATPRPEISVFWQPGCSSCVKAKEFVAEHGFDYESINIRENPDAMAEIQRAGLRSIPAIRRGDRYIYAQSLDDVAALLGVNEARVRLSAGQLLARWDAILGESRDIAAGMDESVLQRRVMPKSERTVSQLAEHIFQIAESFNRQVEDDSIDARAIYLHPNAGIRTRDDLLAYADGIRRAFQQLRADRMPARLNTHYGDQPATLVLERGAWHSAQHARQLDVVAAGMGAEFRLAPALFEGLPMPRRLWS